MNDLAARTVLSSIGASLDEKKQTIVFLGDFLVDFSNSRSPIPCRTPSLKWDGDMFEADWRIWKQAPSSTWKGYPAIHLQAHPWDIWMLGEFYGLSTSDESTEQRLRRFLQNESPATDLNGHFLLFGWNASTRRWHVWTDRFGTLHAYYASGKRSAAIGTFFPAVASFAASRSLDWSGLTGFFSLGFFPQDRTYFENVRIFRPASHYLFDQTGNLLSMERYWEWCYQPDNQRSLQDSTAQFQAILNQIMTEQTEQDRVAIPISGGLDSRTTVASITRKGRDFASKPLWAYSYGYSEDSIETRIAKQVASLRGLDFQSFTIGPYLFDLMEIVTSGIEGFQDVTQCRQASMMEHLSKRSDYVIAAHWGDVWLDDMGTSRKSPPLSENQIPEYALKKFTKRGSEWLLENLCLKNLDQDQPYNLLLEMVRKEISQVNHIENTDFRVKAFKTDQWSFRWTTASLRAFQLANFPRLPFYDTRMTDFFQTVPTEYVSGRKLQIEYLKSFAPDLAGIVWQVYDTNLYRHHLFNSLLLPKRAFKKGWRSITQKKPAERNWEIQFLNEDGRKSLERSLLGTGFKIHEFISPLQIRELMDAFYASPFQQGRGYTISMLLTFSGWLELYG